ncbi:GDP-mannose transporter GONST4 [Hibiscus syriacus]|uniref:GDP-mannose transporter GONST4 n=1 Tax=Hibiscus syriacus TaxID=106335 RepID=A0A6A2YU57_HIBSY|nr:GDP-mannose transporter GONST4 [Hibiscus syriacus]
MPVEANVYVFVDHSGWCCWLCGYRFGIYAYRLFMAFAYLVTITTEMVYIKHMVMNIGLTTWGFVLYNNLLSLMMAPIFWVLTGEYRDVFAALRANAGDWFEPVSFTAVSFSCLFGLLISFFGFAARRAISATAFTVTGVVNKFLTVVINVLIWDKHATPFGLVCLLFTLAGGFFINSRLLDRRVNQQHLSRLVKRMRTMMSKIIKVRVYLVNVFLYEKYCFLCFMVLATKKTPGIHESLVSQL